MCTDKVPVLAFGTLDDDDSLLVALSTKFVAAPVSAHAGLFVGGGGGGLGRDGCRAGEDDPQPAVCDFSDRRPLRGIDRHAGRFVVAPA